MNIVTKRVGLAIVAAAFYPLSVAAAPLDLNLKSSPQIAANGTFTSIPSLLLSFTASNGTSDAPAEAGMLDVAFDGVLEMDSLLSAALNVGPGVSPAPFLGASAPSDFGFAFDTDSGDYLEFLFENSTGTASDVYAGPIVVTLFGEFGSESEFFEFGVQDVPTDISVAGVAPIPLPAGGVLLVGGILALCSIRRFS